MSFGRRLASAGAILALVPIMFGLTLALPDATPLPLGVGEALGCSGGANVPGPPGWVSLTPRLSGERPVVGMATDGFFVIEAGINGLTADAVSSSFSVVVIDAAGKEVAGATRLLEDKGGGRYFFAWVADAPLEMGAQLSATLSAKPGNANSTSVGGQFPLVVVGPPVSPPPPVVTFSRWTDFYHGEGELVSCKAPPYSTGCGEPLIVQVPAATIKQTSALARWELPEVSSSVAWVAHLEASPTQPDAVLPSLPVDYLADTKQPTYVGGVVFPTAASTYCVTLVVKDLRTGDETRGETCAPPETSGEASTDTKLLSCLEPPSPALTQAWCALHLSSTLPACAVNPAGAAGSAGREPGATGTAGSAADNVGAATPSRTSAGCQLGRGGSAPSALAALSLALVLLGLRRLASRCGPAWSPASARACGSRVTTPEGRLC